MPYTDDDIDDANKEVSLDELAEEEFEKDSEEQEEDQF